VRLRIATRGSPLARWQAGEIVRLLREVDSRVDAELVVVTTTGDRRQDVAPWEMGGQADGGHGGVFVKEVQAAVLEGGADVAVHSAKDLPSTVAEGLVLAAVPARADARDALVGSTLEDLGPGAVVATGSVRRRAQLAWLRPDLVFAALRGNIETRLDRVPAGGAAVVAAAALDRLGLSDRATELLDTSVMLPQVAQGALAAECREGDKTVLDLLASIEDPTSRAAVDAERGFLAELGAGCDLPVGAYATVASGELEVEALLASADGRRLMRASSSGPVSGARSLGASLAGELVAAGGVPL
jgi:hydroxymethylbilane synthase